jgi:hypothetical protein
MCGMHITCGIIFNKGGDPRKHTHDMKVHKVELTMLQIAVLNGLLGNHIKDTQEAELRPNYIVSKEYLLETFEDLQSKLDAAWEKALKPAK